MDSKCKICETIIKNPKRTISFFCKKCVNNVTVMKNYIKKRNNGKSI